MLTGGSRSFVKDNPGLDSLVNVHIQEEFDIEIKGSPPDFFSRDYLVTTRVNVLPYPLPDDFRSLQQVYVVEDQATGFMRPIRQVSDIQRLQFRAPQGEFTVNIQYCPSPPKLTDDEGPRGTFSFISGGDELVVTLLARDMLTKQEQLPVLQQINLKLNELRMRVLTNSRTRNQSAPQYKVQVEDYDWPFVYYTQNVNGYRLRGDAFGNPQIELYSVYPYWPR